MSLHIDYRPDCLKEIAGNKQTVKMLEAKLKSENLPHAILLTGPSGCGKTTLARIIRKELGCSEQNYKEIDSAQFRGIDSVREITRQMRLKALGGGSKVYLLDEVHMLGVGGDSATNAAQNALLKALEDTPKHVYFILATTNPERLLKTLRNRCTEYSVEALDQEELVAFLIEICEAEEKEVPKDVLEQIAIDSFGSPRSALVILDKIIDLPEKEMKAAASQIAEAQSQLNELCQSLLKGRKTTWKSIATIIKGLKKEDAEGIRRKMLYYFEAVLLNSGRADVANIMDEFLEPVYGSGWPGLSLSCFCAFNN